MPIKLSLSTSDPFGIAADIVFVGIPEGTSEHEGHLAVLAKALGQTFSKAMKRDEFTGKKDQVLDLPSVGVLKADRVVLFGLGKTSPLTEVEVRLLAAKGARFALGAKAQSIVIVLPEGVKGGERAAAEGAVLGSYRFTKYLTGDRVPKVQLEHVTLAKLGKVGKADRTEMHLGQSIGEAICIARNLINEPPNELHPEALAEAAVAMCKENGLKVTVLDEKAMARKGMNLFLAVGRGSSRPPRLVHMTYTPAVKAKKKLVFVGKGLTFDTGGICIKPAAGMEEMKGDMGGAANVIALMAAVAALKPNVEVHGMIGAAENMPDGDAYRPGDIFKSYDGKTVEVINTDAEGRLVLADVLAYAREQKPDLIVDNATLTGAIVIALGPTMAGYYANREEMAERFKKAAKAAGEAMWHMPLIEELREGLKSDWADIKHVADRWGGSITAGLFLREFVGDVPWIHVDLAGPSMMSKPQGLHAKGGTGHGVLTYLRLVEDFASS